MTLPASLRPGAPTIPQALPGISGSGAAEHAHLQFLSAEERTTAVLMGYFQDARLELEEFIRTGDLTVSDATFYRQLLDETNRIASKVNAQGAEWTSSVIPEGFSAGWRQNSSVVVPQRALQALSGDTLSLITATSDGIRQSVRQAIAQGILQGLPGSAVRQRIIATGLTNIPHWPSVEYRAGVIARTETMKAYNAGNLAAIEENGARFAEWIASPDEAVCSICGPRNGDIFRIGPGDAAGGGSDPYPNAIALPKLPAHPRCRCTIRAVYRGPNGEVIQQGAIEQAPELPLDAMGGRDAPIVPPAVGDFDQALGKLARFDASDFHRPESVAFWRSAGRFDEDQLRAIAGYGKTNSAAHAVTANFLRARYGITFGAPTGWNADLRLATLRGLERIREVSPRYVVDSTYLHSIGIRPPGGRRFGSNVIARAFANGYVEGNMRLWATFAGPNGRKLRAGAAVDAAEEVIIHEFFHTVHSRYGLHYKYGHRAVEAVDEFDFERAWAAIRRKTNPQVMSADSTNAAGSPTDRVEQLRRLAEDRLKAAKGAQSDVIRRSYEQTAERYLEEARKLEAALGGDFFPTEYAKGSAAEDFAESGMLYMLNPAHLKTASPSRYAFFRDEIFGGWEP